MKKYVLYHSGCPDGFGSAFAAWKAFLYEPEGSVEYIPVRYGEDLPSEVEDGSEVYILDFSYPEDVLLELAEKSYLVRVLDHHKTAEEELRGLTGHPTGSKQNMWVSFDPEHSGAVMAWRYFHGLYHRKIPGLLLYVEDRDLWRFELPESREINAAIASYPKTFPDWQKLVDGFEDNPSALFVEGAAILRAQGRVVGGQCKQARIQNLAGHSVPVVNATAHASEVGHELLNLYPDSPFSASYRDTGEEGFREWSLRSRGDFDVSAVARLFGGGGHKAAAGFRERSSGTPGVLGREGSNERNRPAARGTGLSGAGE